MCPCASKEHSVGEISKAAYMGLRPGAKVLPEQLEQQLKRRRDRGDRTKGCTDFLEQSLMESLAEEGLPCAVMRLKLMGVVGPEEAGWQRPQKRVPEDRAAPNFRQLMLPTALGGAVLPKTICKCTM
eukprot:1361945-Alexandrium_andersonii.AAC.1